MHLGSFNNEFQGKALASIAKKKLKAKTALIIYAEDCAYCTDLARSFKKNFKNLKGVILKEIPVLLTDKSFESVIKQVKESKADVILIPNHELFSARIILALASNGIKKIFLGGDGWGNYGEQFLKVLQGQRIEGYSLSHWFSEIPTVKSKEFISSYKSRFNKMPNDTAVLSYDSMNILVETILKTKDHSRIGIEKSLNSLKRFNGVTGTFNYANGGALQKSIVLLKTGISNYKFVKILNPKDLK